MSDQQDDSNLIARIDERTKAILENQEKVDKRLDSHAGKIRNLELWRSLLAGGGTVIAGLLGFKGH